MPNKFRWTTGIVFGLVLAACGGGGSGGGGPAGPGGGTAAFTATIDGQSFAADANTFTVTGNPGVPGSLIISGADVVSGSDYRALSLSVSFIGATGAYPIGINIGTTAGGTASVTDVAGSTVTTWMTSLNGAAGTVTITSLTATRMKGTFSFTADLSPPGPGAQATVTNGSFDVALPSGFTAVPAGNHGSTLTADLGGTAFNAATVVALGDLVAGAFSGGGQTVATSVSLTTATPITTTGIYAVGPEITISVLDFGSGDSWGSGTGAIGTVTITAIGGGRVVGTFAALLVPLGGAAGNLTVTGAFDMLVN